MLPLPPELRAVAFSQLWNASRCQWQLPRAILAAKDSSPARRTFHTSSPLIKTPPARRQSHFHTRRTTSTFRPDPIVFPDSLDDTLEAHRSANLASRIQRIRSGNKNHEVDTISPHLDDVFSDDSKDGGQHVEGEGSAGMRPECSHSQDQPKEYAPVRVIAGVYRGVYKPPTQEWIVTSRGADRNWSRPWLDYLYQETEPSDLVHEYLTAEILAFEKYMELTDSEKAAVKKAFSDIEGLIKSIDPALKVSLIGSCGTGLAMPFSDVDINIEPPNPDSSSLHTPSPRRLGGRSKNPYRNERLARREEVIELLRTIKKTLRKKDGPKTQYIELALIEAQVPIVRARHWTTKLEIQIQSTINGNESTEIVKSHLAELPTLRPLFFVLKQALKMRGMGEARVHGIGSYPLLMMIVAVLKRSSSRFDRHDAGRQLLYFLDFYGGIDFTTTGISVDPPELFPKSPTPKKSTAAKLEAASPSDEPCSPPEGDASITAILAGRKVIARNSMRFDRPWLMCLQDPANPYNDLGAKALGIKHIRATFRGLRSRMQTSINKFGQRPSTAWFSILEPCLVGDYTKFEEKRHGQPRSRRMVLEAPLVANYT